MLVPSEFSGPQSSLWRISVAATTDTVAAYEEAIDPFCQAISWIATEIDDKWQIEGFCNIEPDPADLNQALAVVAEVFSQPVPVPHIEAVEPRDWVLENLRTFPPIHAERFFIYGSHYESPPPLGRIGICLNPGRAFGSGDHATTQGCLLALDGLARNNQFNEMLDMGCGSGILAIAMARTWARSMTAPVMAADNDPKAVLVAAENARRNGVGPSVRALAGDGYKSEKLQRTGPYDLIVSNILANPLRRMAAELGRNLKSAEHGGGVAVLSGFLIRDAGRVLAAHRHQGLHLLRWYDIKGWRTLVLQRQAA